MKTILPALPLLLVVSCSQTPPARESWQGTTGPKTEAMATHPAHATVETTPSNSPAVTVPGIVPVEPMVTNATSMGGGVRTNGAAAPVVARPAGEANPAPGAGAPPVAGAVPGAQPGTQPGGPAPGSPGAPGNPTAPAATGPAAAAAEDIIPVGMIDFRNMPLDQFLTVYADFVGRTLLRPANLNLQQQISLTTKTPLTRSEVIQAMDAVMGLNNVTIINVGDKFVKVVPQPQALLEAGATDGRTAAELPDIGRFVTHVVQLKFTKPSEIVPVLQPFAKMNSIVPIETSQIVVIRDYTENVKRMLEMIERVDISVPSEFESEVIFIKYAKASEIADALNSLSGGSSGATVGGGRTQQQGGRAGGTQPNRPGQGGYSPGGAVSPFAQNTGLGGGGGLGGAGGGANAPAGSSFTDRLQRIIQRASASGDLQILGQTKMIADERSNSLLVFASHADMLMIKNIVSKLDVVLAQVLIETVIMDVTLDDSWAFGVSAGQPPKTVGSVNVGGVNNNPGDASGNAPLSTLNEFLKGTISSTNAGSAISTIFPSSQGLTYFARWPGNLDVAVQAAANDSRVNVIQKPRILTTHATQASVFIGNTVPYVTSTYYGGGFQGGPSSSYQQLQVGIGLSVTPYINPDGLVVMQLEETIDEISGSTAIAGVGNVPNTTSRKFSAEVAVRDGDSVILGGFIRNSTDKAVSGVPLLKDIPLLGAFFTSRSSSKSRKELIVMMRPTVLRTPEVAALATVEEKKRLPGVSAAEAENNELEKKFVERLQKESFKKQTPMTTEEQKKYFFP